MRIARAIAPLLLANWLCQALSPAPAQAFSRSRDASDESVCLYWEARTAIYYVNEYCSADINDIDECLNAVRTSFNVWSMVPCGEFDLVDGGTTPLRDVGFDQDNWRNNINLVVWYEDTWDSAERSAIALTTNTYDSSTGEIVDADIELNGVYFTFSTPASAHTATDIQNTLVHEVGHVIGLDHSTVVQASMYATAQQGETSKRNLDQDDIDGICYIYPANGPTPACGNGVCKPADGPAVGEPCENNQNCPVGQLCQSGMCYMPCHNDLDCESHEHCALPEVDRGCGCGTGGGISLVLGLLAVMLMMAIVIRKKLKGRFGS